MNSCQIWYMVVRPTSDVPGFSRMLDLQVDTKRVMHQECSVGCKGLHTRRNSIISLPSQEEWVCCGHAGQILFSDILLRTSMFWGHTRKQVISCAFPKSLCINPLLPGPAQPTVKERGAEAHR